jgi:hypothetical protein
MAKRTASISSAQERDEISLVDRNRQSDSDAMTFAGEGARSTRGVKSFASNN